MKPLKSLIFIALMAIPVIHHASVNKPKIIELDRILVIANEQVITYSELERKVKLITYKFRQQKSQLPSIEILQKQILDRLISDRLQLQLAERAGIRIDDEAINNVLTNIAARNNMTLKQFQENFKSDGFDFSEIRDNIHDEMVLSQLRKRQVESKIVVTEQEIQNQLNKNLKSSDINTSYNISHILIPLSESAGNEDLAASKQKALQVLKKLRNGANFAKIAISVSKGQNALDGGKLDWRKATQLPIKFTELLSKMKKNDISDLIKSASGFHILKLNDIRTNKEKHMIDQTKASHILISTSQLVSNENARDKLNRIRARILNGENFAKLAQTHSSDKSSAVSGGSLGWVSPGSMVARFETQMDKLKIGEVSKIFKTQFGWHIIKVLKRRKLDNTTKYIHDQVRDQIRQRKIGEAVQNWIRQIRDEAFVEYKFNN